MDNDLIMRKKEVNVKLERLRHLMDDKNLKAIALTHNANFAWLTAGGNSVVTISNEAGIATLLVTEDAQYVLTTVIESGRLLDEEFVDKLGFEMVALPWHEDKLAEAIEMLADAPLAEIGSDLSLGSAQLVSKEINKLRSSLLPGEIDRYMQLGITLSTVLEDFMTKVKPGMTEYEITGKLCDALWPHNIDQILFLVSADERAYKYRHGIPNGKKLEKHLNVSVNGRYKGLITTVTRMVHFGKASEELKKQFRDTVEIENRIIAAMRIGDDELVPYEVCKKAYADAGASDMWIKHSQGGPTGYMNRHYSITPECHDIIQPNQAYCFNPVIDGTKSEDPFIITEDGPVFITRRVTYPSIESEVDGMFFDRPGLLEITL